jgi:hypothetical protein
MTPILRIVSRKVPKWLVNAETVHEWISSFRFRVSGDSDVSMIQHNLKWSLLEVMKMMERIAEASPRLKARITGAFYLFTLLTGIFAQGFVWRGGRGMGASGRNI